MSHYHIDLFWSEADGCRVADVPDLKSCSALGDTPAEALAEVERAIEAWLDVALDEHRWADDVAQGTPTPGHPPFGTAPAG